MERRRAAKFKRRHGQEGQECTASR